MTAAEGTARDGVMAPARRATSVGLVLVITLIGFEAMAIATVMPRVSRVASDTSRGRTSE